MEGAVEDDHRGSPGRDACDLDGVLDRFGPAVQQHRLLVVAAARRELGQAAAHLDVGLVHPDHEALVQVAVDLGVNRVDDRRERVPEVRAAEAAGEVDVLASVGVPDPRSLRAADDERRRRDATRDVPLAGLLNAPGFSALVYRHRTGDCISAEAADTMGAVWRLGRVVRQRPAKPFTAVRIR